MKCHKIFNIKLLRRQRAESGHSARCASLASPARLPPVGSHTVTGSSEGLWRGESQPQCSHKGEWEILRERASADKKMAKAAAAAAAAAQNQ